MKASILTIGDELLIGQVIDSNSAWIGQQLELANIQIIEKRSIQDTEEKIIDTLDQLSKISDVIIMTGGLGPTKDDVTKYAIAKYFDVSLYHHEESYQQVKSLLNKVGIPIRESHKLQAQTPETAEVLPNKLGTAQGIWIQRDDLILIATPGVPYEMKYILSHHGIPKLQELNPDGQIRHRTIMTVGSGETKIEESIQDIVDDLPPEYKVAYLPNLGNVRVRLSMKSSKGMEDRFDQYFEAIADRLVSITYGYDNVSLEEAVGKMLVDHKKMIGTAESCSGGYISHKITSIPGASAYYKGSIVAYENIVKTQFLKVKESSIKQYGAVSQEVVEQMVTGVCETLGVDIGISASGIAGPTGGTPQKPVGTIWVAVGSKDKVISQKLQLTKNRLKNIEYTSIVALNLVRKFLLEEEKAAE